MAIEEPLYPVNLRLAGRPVLVVGGGTVAASKVAGLRRAGALVTVVAPEVVDELAQLGRAAAPAATASDDPGAAGTAGASGFEQTDDGPPIRLVQRRYRAQDLEGQRLVVTATDDPAVNAQVATEADAAGIWVNAADDPDNCTYILPAVLRRGPVLVTVGTGGASPAVAAWLRDQVAAEFGPELQELVELVATVREEILASGRSTQGLRWQVALGSGVLDLLHEGRRVEARERLQACLSLPSD